MFVLKKEYCEAKKSENRFRIAKGTKFYRVLCCRPEDGERRLRELRWDCRHRNQVSLMCSQIVCLIDAFVFMKVFL